MTYIHLSIEKQKQALQEVLLNVFPATVNWDHFSLNFQQILEFVCDIFKENDLQKARCLDSLVRKFGIPADPNLHFELLKERIDYYGSYHELESLYKLSSFDIDGRKALLHIVLRKIEEYYVKTKEFDLVLMSELKLQEKLEKGKLYIKLEGGIIKYKVLDGSNTEQSGEIKTIDMPSGVAFPTSNDLGQFSQIKKDILKITSKRVHITTDGTIYHIDLDLFNLTFNDVFEVACNYKKILCSIITSYSYLQTFLDKASDSHKKLFLHIYLQQIEEYYAETGYGRQMNFNLFDLPFDGFWEIVCQYKKVPIALIISFDDVKKYLSTASSSIKTDYILRALLEGHHDNEFILSVTSEIERGEIFKKFVQLDLDKFFRAKDWFFADWKISNPFNRQEKFYLLKKLLNHHSEDVNLDLFWYKFIELDLSEESGILGNLSKELKSITQEIEYDQNAIRFATLFKQKILDFDASQIWDNKNKELFSKELKFLSEHRNVDEQTSFIFMRIADWLIYTVVLYNYLSEHNPALHDIVKVYDLILTSTLRPQQQLEQGKLYIKHENNDVIRNTFKEIRSFSNPSMRFKLTQLFLENICSQKEAYDLYIHFVDDDLSTDSGEVIKNKNQVSLLPALILVSNFVLQEEKKNAMKEDVRQGRGLIKETLTKIIKNKRRYKDGKHMRPLIAGLHAIFSQEKISTIEEKFELANKILEKKIDLHKNIWLSIGAIFMPAIINHPSFADFYETIMKEVADFNLIFQQICCDVFQVTSQERISNYNKTFRQKHNLTALLTYYAKMQSLIEPERTQMLEVLNKYFNSVLADGDESYIKLRYCTDSNPQLKVIFEHYPDLKPKWEQGYLTDYRQFIEDHKLTNVVGKQFDLKSFVVNMIMQNHLPNEYCEEFKEYIKQKQERKLEIKKELNKEKDTLKQTGNLEKSLQNRLNACELQLELIDAISNNYRSREEQVNKLQKTIKFIDKAKLYCEFRENLTQAIRALTRNRSKETTNYDVWKIVDTDNYWSMFMAGTDIEGSCQRVDGDPKLNKCLMGYVMNGDYRMLAIENTQGITVARCIIHLLWDEERKLASLFMEEAYPFYINYIQEQALIQLAINRAKHLGLNLVSITGEDADSLDYYGNTLLRIKGGVAPWIYSDATHNKVAVKDQNIEIKNAKFLYNRDKSLYLDKRKELDAEALRYGVNVYQQNEVFFSGSKFATPKQPYGPYSDRLCCPKDPITELAVKCSKLSLTI